MNKKSVQSVDAYVSALPEHVRAVLQRMRAVIRTALPDAEETISYQIPTYKLHGRPVLYLAVWKEYCSVYPAPDTLIAALPELAAYKVSKGTLRFPLAAPVPLKLIGRLAKLRASEVTGRAAAKPAPKRRARR